MGLRFEDEEIEWDKHAPREQTQPQRSGHKGWLLQWKHEIPDLPWFWLRLHARLQEDHRQQQQTEEHEGTDAHGPWKANSRDESSNDDPIFVSFAQQMDGITYGTKQPLSDDPEATTPKANARFFRNHEPTGPIPAENNAAAPRALQIDCARKIW